MKNKACCPWYLASFQSSGGLPGGKESACQCRRHRFYPWVRKIPWRRKWQTTAVFLPGKFPWTEEPGRLQSMRLQRVEHNWAYTHTVTWIYNLAVCVFGTQSRCILCNPVDCSLPGSSVHGILQARILEWVAIPFSRGLSQPRDWTRVSCIAGGPVTI